MVACETQSSLPEGAQVAPGKSGLHVRGEGVRVISIEPWKHGEGNGNPLQYSCLENPTDGGAWWAAVYAEGNTEGPGTASSEPLLPS